MHWWEEDRSTWTKVAEYPQFGSVLWLSPASGHITTDPDGRITIPVPDRKRFWSSSTEEKIAYLFDLVTRVECSAGWATERLHYLGLVDDEHYLECKFILMHLYEGETPLDEVKDELRSIGVKV